LCDRARRPPAGNRANLTAVSRRATEIVSIFRYRENTMQTRGRKGPVPLPALRPQMLPLTTTKTRCLSTRLVIPNRKDRSVFPQAQGPASVVPQAPSERCSHPFRTRGKTLFHRHCSIRISDSTWFRVLRSYRIHCSEQQKAAPPRGR